VFRLKYQNSEAEGGAGGNEEAACAEGDLLSVDESNPSPENNEATAPTQAADLMVCISIVFINYFFSTIYHAMDMFSSHIYDFLCYFRVCMTY
jgi:hypothetical protein